MKRSRYLLILALMMGVMWPGMAQNLLQNPGFESASSWDDFWLLSTTAPSSVSAVAVENTSDVHEGLKSVELSNTVPNKWTYFYSDAVNAPLIFEAGQRYLIKGWIKSLEEAKELSLSVFWNNSQDQQIFYDQNPNPLSHPDWFLVEDTLTASEDFADGYLSLGFRAAKIGASTAAGKLLVDDFSVTRLPSRETDITYFSIPEQIGDAIIDVSSHTVNIDIPTGTDVTALVPEISLSAGAQIVPGSGMATDFSMPFLYMVTAEDGTTTQAWTVIINILPPFTDTDILAFSIPEQTGPATIDNVFHTVIVEAAYGTDLSSITPVIGLAPGASINPGSGLPTDLSSPKIFTVTAQDGIATQDYIIVAMNSPVSTETDIISFVIAEEVGPAIIDELWHTVSIEVPYGTDVTALLPTIEISDRATILPGSGVPGDFTAPLAYTVLAEDGTTSQDWTVTVFMISNDQTDIESFSIDEEAGPAIIDKLWHTISIEVPAGTDVTALLPTIELSAGAQILPGSGVPGDFTAPLIYTVVAENGTTSQIWTVTVHVLPNDQAEIDSFSFGLEVNPANIDKLSHTVSLELPYGTDVSALVPTITISAGATMLPGSGVQVDFSNPVSYMVTAEDGATKQEWKITVRAAPNDQTDIESFYLADQVGPAKIDKLQHTVSLAVPYGTDITTLTPTIALSAGATISPSSSVSMDFTSTVIFTVTAEDGLTKQDWITTVLVLPNNQTDIESFSVAEEVGPATINTLLHSVSLEVEKETDLSTLIPSIELSEGASIDPGSGRVTDFSAPVEYTVTADDGVSVQNWTVTVTAREEAVNVFNSELDDGVRIYPNPAREFVQIEISGKADISLLDITGRIAVTLKDVSENASIPVAGLERGAYLVHVKWRDSHRVFRLLLE